MQQQNTNNDSFDTFLENLKSRMKNVFHLRADINQMATKRGMPPFVMREIMDLKPLSVGIPAEYGGRGCKMEENLALLATASYESLAYFRNKFCTFPPACSQICPRRNQEESISRLYQPSKYGRIDDYRARFWK